MLLGNFHTYVLHYPAYLYIMRCRNFTIHDEWAFLYCKQFFKYKRNDCLLVSFQMLLQSGRYRKDTSYLRGFLFQALHQLRPTLKKTVVARQKRRGGGYIQILFTASVVIRFFFSFSSNDMNSLLPILTTLLLAQTLPSLCLGTPVTAPFVKRPVHNIVFFS